MSDKTPKIAQDLIRKLLVLDQSERLGSNSNKETSVQSLKSHKFFEGIHWESLWVDSPPGFE